jgi:hypothetical protein
VRLEELGKLKNVFTSWDLETATFRLLSQCLNHYTTADILPAYMLLDASV